MLLTTTRHLLQVSSRSATLRSNSNLNGLSSSMFHRHFNHRNNNINNTIWKRRFSQESPPPPPPSNQMTFLQKFLGPKEMPPRGTLRWYGEVTLICTVFAITGTSTMVLVRPAVSQGLGLEGSFKDGPWSYRICSLVIMSPLYSVLLVAVGTVFGRHFYFRHFAVKMISRFGIPPELMDKNFHKTAKNFRKW